MKEIIERTKDFIILKSDNRDNTNKAVEKAYSILADWEINSDVIENKGHKMLVSKIGKGKDTIILNGHLDVVPGEERQFHPFISGSKLFGRGSYDMLGACSVMMEVFKELYNEDLSINIILMLVSTEETNGSLCTKYLIDQGYNGDFTVCGEPTNLKVSTMSKGILQLRLKVYGFAAHSSKPWLGENALVKSYKIYNEILNLPFMHEKNKYIGSPTVNLSKIEGGNFINKVPEYSEMYVDIRYLPGQDPKTIINSIKDIENNMDLEIIQVGSSVYTKLDNKYVKKLVDQVKKTTKKEEIITFQHGTADTRFFYDAKIPSVEFGPIGANHHGKNEYVDIDSLFLYKKILKDFLLSI